MKFSLNFLDVEAKEFCERVVSEMVTLFSITEEEAITRVNCHWAHIESIGGQEELIYHEDERFWAQDIYYGSDSYWWLEENVRSEKGLPNLVPKGVNNA